MRITALALAWLGGVALQLQQASLWPPGAYAASVFAALLLLPFRRFPALAIAAVLAGLGITGGHATIRLAQSLSPALEGVDVEVTGVIAALPRVGVDGTRFAFDIERAVRSGAEVALPPHVLLGWWRGFDDEAPAAPTLRAGERWRFTVRLKQPHGNVNPHGFDHELWLFERGLRATGYVRGEGVRLDAAAGHPVERLRQRLRDGIFATVPDARAAGVLAALAVGDQGSIDGADWEVFRATGTAHLMAISGLHVTMFAWLAGAAVGWAWRRSSRLMLALPAPLAARWGGLAAAAAYALLAGWGVPAQRTVWMLGTAALLASLSVCWPWPLVLALAAVVVTVLDPWALLQPGFWLSFAAVGLLMASTPPRAAPEHDDWRGRVIAALRGGVRTQTIATVGLAPLSLLCFQQVSLVGFAANLAAIPLVTLVVTPLALLGAFGAAAWSLGAWVLQALAQALAALAALPGAVWVAPVSPWWAQLLGLAAGALFVLPLPRRLRALGVPLLVPLVWPVVERPPDGRFELVAVDIGQGNAVLVRTRSHLLVYDAGPQYGRDSDAGARVLLPLLLARGEAAVDALVLSHRDADHVGGAPALIAGLPVRTIRGSLDALHPLRAAGVPFTPCAAADGWTWDNVRFTVLHPTAFEPKAKPNSMSCVLRIEDAHGASALLAGDIEARQEASLVAARGAALKSDVLLVPHHGSRTSSTEAFISAVAPSVALVQAGYRNRFGHPAPDVVQRYSMRGTRVVTSAACGAWTWRGDAGTCERVRGARYWHASLAQGNAFAVARR